MTQITTQQQFAAGGLVPLDQSLQNLMGMEGFGSEMTQGVGPTYAVISVKGRNWSIRHNGQSTPLMANFNGAMVPAPFYDVVLVRANPHMSKTFYKDGYSEGSDDAPTCWSENGVTPDAPETQRPVNPATGRHCMSCAECPANAFGSRKLFNPQSQGEGKACADTRKVAVIPVDPATGKADVENIRNGGPMLLRVPAASLKPFAEYASKLQQMGLPYMAVVTRMAFDQQVAYPKVSLQPVRQLDAQEQAQVVAAYNGMAVKQLLEAGHVAAAPALPAPAATLSPEMAALQAQQVMPVAPAAPQVAQPVVQQAPPAPVAQPVVQQAPPAPVAQPVAQPAPVAPPAPPAPVAAPQWPPAGWFAHPDAPGFFYNAQQEVVAEAELRSRFAPATPAAPAAPPPPAAVMQAVEQAPAPAQSQITVSESTLRMVDQLLG